MASEEITIGTIVWVAKLPLALFTKPKNAPKLWRAAIVIEEGPEDGYVIASAGNRELVKCHKNHLRPIVMGS